MIDAEAIGAWVNEQANEHASELVGFINELIAEVRGLREELGAAELAGSVVKSERDYLKERLKECEARCLELTNELNEANW